MSFLLAPTGLAPSSVQPSLTMASAVPLPGDGIGTDFLAGLRSAALRGGGQESAAFLTEHAGALRVLLSTKEGRIALSVATASFVVGFKAAQSWPQVEATAAALRAVAVRHLLPARAARAVAEVLTARLPTVYERGDPGAAQAGRSALQPLVRSIDETRRRLGEAYALKAQTGRPDDDIDVEIRGLTQKLQAQLRQLPSARHASMPQVSRQKPGTPPAVAFSSRGAVIDSAILHSTLTGEQAQRVNTALSGAMQAADIGEHDVAEAMAFVRAMAGDTSSASRAVLARTGMKTGSELTERVYEKAGLISPRLTDQRPKGRTITAGQLRPSARNSAKAASNGPTSQPLKRSQIIDEALMNSEVRSADVPALRRALSTSMQRAGILEHDAQGVYAFLALLNGDASGPGAARILSLLHLKTSKDVMALVHDSAYPPGKQLTATRATVGLRSASGPLLPLQATYAARQIHVAMELLRATAPAPTTFEAQQALLNAILERASVCYPGATGEERITNLLTGLGLPRDRIWVDPPPLSTDRLESKKTSGDGKPSGDRPAARSPMPSGSGGAGSTGGSGMPDPDEDPDEDKYKHWDPTVVLPKVVASTLVSAAIASVLGPNAAFIYDMLPFLGGHRGKEVGELRQLGRASKEVREAEGLLEEVEEGRARKNSDAPGLAKDGNVVGGALKEVDAFVNPQKYLRIGELEVSKSAFHEALAADFGNLAQREAEKGGTREALTRRLNVDEYLARRLGDPKKDSAELRKYRAAEKKLLTVARDDAASSLPAERSVVAPQRPKPLPTDADIAKAEMELKRIPGVEIVFDKPTKDFAPGFVTGTIRPKPNLFDAIPFVQRELNAVQVDAVNAVVKQYDHNIFSTIPEVHIRLTSETPPAEPLYQAEVAEQKLKTTTPDAAANFDPNSPHLRKKDGGASEPRGASATQPRPMAERPSNAGESKASEPARPNVKAGSTSDASTTHATTNTADASRALQTFDDQYMQAYGSYLTVGKDAGSTSRRTRVLSWQKFDAFIDQRMPRDAGENGLNRRVAGFLDPKTKTIYVRGDSNGNLLPLGGDTYMHEKTHDLTSAAFTNSLKRSFSNMGSVSAFGYDYLNEGITQMYTTRLSGIDHAGSFYGPRVKYAERVEQMVGADTLKKAFFGGDPQAIEAVQKAVASMRRTR